MAWVHQAPHILLAVLAENRAALLAHIALICATTTDRSAALTAAMAHYPVLCMLTAAEAGVDAESSSVIVVLSPHASTSHDERDALVGRDTHSRTKQSIK